MLTRYGQQPSGMDWARLGIAGANAINRGRAQEQDRQNQARQEEVYRVADAIIQNPDVDINTLSNDPVVRMGARAQAISMQLRQYDQSEAGKKAILSDMNLNQKNLTQAYSAWKSEPPGKRKNELAIAMHNLTPDGKNAELTKDGVRFTITETDETFDSQIPTDAQIDEAMMPFLQPQSYIQSYMVQRQARIDYNQKQLMNPKPLYDKKGDAVGFTNDFIDKESGRKQPLYFDEDGQQIEKPKGSKTKEEWAMVSSQASEKRKADIFPIQKETAEVGLKAAKQTPKGDETIKVDGRDMTIKQIESEMKTLKSALAPPKGDKPLMLITQMLEADEGALRTELDRLESLAKKASPQSKKAAQRYLDLFRALTGMGEGTAKEPKAKTPKELLDSL